MQNNEYSIGEPVVYLDNSIIYYDYVTYNGDGFVMLSKLGRQKINKWNVHPLNEVLDEIGEFMCAAREKDMAAIEEEANKINKEYEKPLWCIYYNKDDQQNEDTPVFMIEQACPRSKYSRRVINEFLNNLVKGNARENGCFKWKDHIAIFNNGNFTFNGVNDNAFLKSPKIDYSKGIRCAAEKRYWFGVDRKVHSMDGSTIGQFKNDIVFSVCPSEEGIFSRWNGKINMVEEGQHYGRRITLSQL